MNDPGLDEPISNAEAAVGKKHDDSDSNMDEEEEEVNFLVPAKWWYASTAFPLLAGTFGPMANAFSVCALVENWRVKIPKGGTEEHGIDIRDPRWLIAVNAVSLVCALMANMALLLNMARRLSFAIAQPITIIGFWTASVLLIGLVAVASHDFHAPGVKDQALTQAYYYGIFAAALYQIISYLMCFTVWGAYRGQYSKEFKLTMAQRTLMLQTISFLVYLLLGALVYSKIEGWTFLDAVYWADFTALTIGIGDDFAPSTHLGRGLLFPFALGGILILGLVVGSIRSLVLDRSKKKLSARMTEKTRRRVVKRIAAANESTRINSKQKAVHGLDKQTASVLTLDPSDHGPSEIQRRKAEFDAMRRVQEMAATERKWISLMTSTFAFAFLWTIGAVVFWKAEKNQKWTYFEAFYFSYTTLLTIGYGDFQPESNSGKPFFVFWSLLAVPTLTILISNMGDTVVKAIKDLTIWLGEITVLPSDEGGIKDRLKYGVHKATHRKINLNGKGSQSDEYDNEMKSFQELNPGMVHMPREDDSGNRRQERDVETGKRLTTDFEQSEELDEQEAKKRGDVIAEDGHHYRHMLISEIRKVWNDSSAVQPKKYSYAEWAHFLRLLGEDENDSRFHRRPPTKSKLEAKESKKSEKDSAAQQKAEFQTVGQKDAHSSNESPSKEESDDADKDHDTTINKWSWIGTRSPLMGEKDEPDWLLEKLFQRLEESLKDNWDEHLRSKEVDGKKERLSQRKDRKGGTQHDERRGQGQTQNHNHNQNDEKTQEDAIRRPSSGTLRDD